MTEETAQRIAVALERIGARLIAVMVAAVMIAGQFLAFNFNHPH